MRVIIAFEGQSTIPTQFLDHGSLKWGDEKLPVEFVGFQNPPVGFATDIRRDDHGQVTAELELIDEKYAVLVPGDLAATVWCNELDYDRDENDRIIMHSGRIRAIMLTPNVPWVGLNPGDRL